MSAFLDSSVLVAALAPDEPKHADCLALLLLFEIRTAGKSKA
jgi:predicted nucleic acid-binding protein